MDAINRAVLLKNLMREESVLTRYEGNFLEAGEAKLGQGLNNIVVGKDYVSSNLPHPANPGFHFSAEGSQIRQGTHLDFDRAFNTVFFKGGEQMLNPLSTRRASSTTDPLPAVVPTLRGVSDAFLSRDLKALLGVLKSL